MLNKNFLFIILIAFFITACGDTFTSVKDGLTGAKRKSSDDIMGDYWTRVAFDVQNEWERCMVHLGKEIEKKIKSKNICMAGGVALNSVANQKLFNETNFKEIFVFPACSDTGVPFGLAIWGLYNSPKIIKKPKKIKKLVNAYTGIKYSSNYISDLL